MSEDVINADEIVPVSQIPDNANFVGKAAGDPIMVPWSVIKSLFAAVELLEYKADQETLTLVQKSINALSAKIAALPKIYEWLIGVGVPDNEDGNDGQMFLNTDGQLYQKITGVWVYQLTLGDTKFLGTYTSLALLTAAHPAPNAGSYAYIDAGVGADVVIATWDATDGIWIEGATTGTGETAVSIKTKYESNANTNAFTDAFKATLEGLAVVASSGAYNDLSGKPTLAQVATSGDAQDLSNLIAAIDTALAGTSYWREDQKANLTATTAPGLDDDSSAGYAVRSLWIDVNNGEAYRCVDASVGAAVWLPTTLTADELADVAISGSYADLISTPPELSQALVEAGVSTTFGLVSPERLAQAIAALGASGTAGEYGEVAISSVTSLDNSHAGKLLRADMTGGAYDIDIAAGLTKNRIYYFEILDATNPLTFDAGVGVTIEGPTSITEPGRVVTLVHTNTQDTYRVYVGDDVLRADVSQSVPVGYSTPVHDLGSVATGTVTPDEADGAVQKLENAGAFTLNPPVNNTIITLKITNHATTAGAITTSGFTAVVGDTLTTTGGDKFICHIQKVDGDSILSVTALQ